VESFRSIAALFFLSSTRLRLHGGTLLAALLIGLSIAARAQAAAAVPVDEALTAQVRALAQKAAEAATANVPGTRVAIEVGSLDPRLKLAPCADVQPYLPANMRLWGRARIGLRCANGPVKWNVYMPVQVQVFARSTVAAGALAAGTVLAASDLRQAEVDLAAEPGAAIAQPALAVGRTLARAVPAGAALRTSHLKARQYFAAGDTVTVVAVGKGYSVSGEGQAMNPGLEGQPVRVRTEGGRIVSGLAVAERRVEVAL
jgi:flagella basal body P-ring formation protein FlgA